MVTTKGKITWQPLKPGDLVDLVAPGWPCTEAELQEGIRKMESWGLRVRRPEGLFGSDQVRLQSLREALEAKDSKAIWCARGGYGSLRLMPTLMGWKRPSRCKLFVGYSDITTLHLWFNQKWGWPTVHGPLVDRLGSAKFHESDELNIKNLIFERPDEASTKGSGALVFDGLDRLNEIAGGKLEGPILGGNLTVLTSAVGTRGLSAMRGAFLFLEDTGERAYRIDRMMQQLLQSGSLKGVKVVLLGQFLGGVDKDGVSRVTDYWKGLAQMLSIPVIAGLPVGHGDTNQCLPLGTSARLLGRRLEVLRR
jgi:muramoyltetrapeptide carboxypeptidase